jgi:hypothetical protein
MLGDCSYLPQNPAESVRGVRRVILLDRQTEKSLLVELGTPHQERMEEAVFMKF